MEVTRKRRSMSNVDTLASTNATNTTEPVQKKRRQSNARQAKLVAFPMFGMNRPPPIPQPPGAQYYPFPVYPIPNPQQMLPKPTVNNNSMFFTLPPSYGDISFSFSITVEMWQKVFLQATALSRPLRFSINRTYFDGPFLPVDVTGALVKGENNIRFFLEGIGSTVYVELSLQNSVSAEDLTKQITEKRLSIREIKADKSASKICPISGKMIELAARGEECTHFQTFDLFTFITNGMLNGKWACPICAQHISVDRLRYDDKYFQRLDEAQKTPSLLLPVNNNDDDIFSGFSLAGMDGLDSMFFERDF